MTATHTKRSMAELETWGHPDAPTRYEKGRRCEAPLSACATAEQLSITGQKPEVGRVSSYATSIVGVLLCEPCRRKLVRRGMDAATLAGKEEEKNANRAGPKKSGWPLPHLRDVRKWRDMTCDRLGLLAECSPKTIQAIEGERHQPSGALAHRLAFALRVSVKDLRGDEDDEEVA